MKRLCIYVTYDIENIVDNYIGYMLQELRKLVDCLVVVCNYKEIAGGIEHIQPYVDKIYCRDNVGFDAGAYKDALCTYIGWDEVCKYDELWLVNDSFYGPVHPFDDLISMMDGTDADYWGMTRMSAGKFIKEDYAFDTHIQSYFLVIKNGVLGNGKFRMFWEELPYAESLFQAIVLFEIGMNDWLKMSGYNGLAVTDLRNPDYWLNVELNPYLLHPLELIRDAGIPILKRKSLDLGNTRFKNALMAIKEIENNSGYDVNLIFNHISRISKFNRSCGMINFKALDEFYREHSKIYIYGAGVYGRNLEQYFNYRGWKFESFLVTKGENLPEDCRVFGSVSIENDDGVIIAIADANGYLEIKRILEKCCKSNQIFKRTVFQN